MSTVTSDTAIADLVEIVGKWAEQAGPSQAREALGAAVVLDEQSGLRRSLTDPSHTAQERASLAHRVFDQAVSTPVSQIIAELAVRRQHDDRGLADALESAGVMLAGLAARRRAGDEGLDVLVDELLGLRRQLEDQPELQRALTDPRAAAGAKLRLLDRLVPQLGEEARLLAEQSVEHPRGLPAQRLLAAWADLITRMRRSQIAQVRTAHPLDEQQRHRLRQALERLYGRELKVVIEEDRSLVGGIRIQVGDELLDGSIAGRLDDLQARLGA